MTESPVSESGDAATDPVGLLATEGTVSDLLKTVLDVAVASVASLGAATVTVATSDPAGYRTVCATSDSVKEVDEVQYVTGGPCVQAIQEAAEMTLTLPSPRWPAFSQAAAGVGTSAVWSLPLAVGTRSTGALNLYASTPAPWAGDGAEVARLLAAQADTIFAQAVDLARAQQINLTLRRALETRTVIGQAQGVLMARQGVTAEQAFDILRRASQRTNRKLRDIAADIISGLTGDGGDR